MPGDRDNDYIKTVEAIAADIFDKIIIKEDLNLRNRRPGNRKTS